MFFVLEKRVAFSGHRQGVAQTAGAVQGRTSQASSGRQNGAKTKQGDLTPELPYNRFKAGEGVLVSHQAAQEVWRSSFQKHLLRCVSYKPAESESWLTGQFCDAITVLSITLQLLSRSKALWSLLSFLYLACFTQ